MIEARGDRTAFVRILAPARERDQGNFISPGFMADPLGDFVAGHVRQPDIDHADLRLHRGRHRQRLGAGIREMRFVTLHLHVDLQCLGTVAIVIGDEYPPRWCARAV